VRLLWHRRGPTWPTLLDRFRTAWRCLADRARAARHV